MMPISDDTDALPGQKALRQRIGWLCHGIRLAALGYALWVLLSVILYWTDPEAVKRAYQHWLNLDISAINTWQLMAGFGIHFLIWVSTAAACYAVWRLFSSYLAGRIFTTDAAVWLRRIGTFGLIAQIGDMLTRPLIIKIVSAHLPEGKRMNGIFFNPTDLLNILFLAGFVALAYVFHVAAEMAEDHSQIV